MLELLWASGHVLLLLSTLPGEVWQMACSFPISFAGGWREAIFQGRNLASVFANHCSAQLDFRTGFGKSKHPCVVRFSVA